MSRREYIGSRATIAGALKHAARSLRELDDVVKADLDDAAVLEGVAERVDLRDAIAPSEASSSPATSPTEAPPASFEQREEEITREFPLPGKKDEKKT